MTPLLRAARAIAATWLLLSLPAVRTAEANPESARLISTASDRLYNLDFERATATYRDAIKADANDAAAYRGLASALWAQVAFTRGTMTVDSFLGQIGRAHV